VNLGDYIIPTRLLILFGVLLLVVIGVVAKLTVFSSSSPSPSSVPAVVGTTAPGTAGAHPSSPLLTGQQALVKGFVFFEVCTGKGQKRHCLPHPAARVRLEFRSLRLPHKLLHVRTDKRGSYSLKLSAGPYLLRALGHPGPVRQLNVFPHQVMQPPPLFIVR
jgi:hypothetical protein